MHGVLNRSAITWSLHYFYWDPSTAPSGAAFYDGDLFSARKGNLFVGALRDRMISHVKIGNGSASEVERLLEDKFGFIRDVRNGPDGAIWFATDDNEGVVYRIIPAR